MSRSGRVRVRLFERKGVRGWEISRDSTLFDNPMEFRGAKSGRGRSCERNVVFLRC